MAFYDFVGEDTSDLPAGLIEQRGDCYIENNELRFNGLPPGNPRWLVLFQNESVGSFKCQAMANSSSGIVRIYARYLDDANSILLNLNYGSQKVIFLTYDNNAFTQAENVSFTLETGVYYEVEVEDTGTSCIVRINGQEVLEYVSNAYTGQPSKGIGADDASVRYDSLTTDSHLSGGGEVNNAPVASLGNDQNITTGIEFTADASGSSEADKDTITYSDVLAKPAGSSATLSNETTASPSFTPDLDGEYTLTLTVNDGTEDSSPVSQTLTATAATDAITMSDDFISDLGGSGSLQCALSNDVTASTWSITQAPTGSSATISNANANPATFTPDVIGLYEATITATTPSGTDTGSYYFRVRESLTTPTPLASIRVNGEVKKGEKVTLIAEGKYL